ncbi:MAG: glycosyltransferase family 2 protein [Actinomycetota bacterium]|nr:glycosyltransferase family 2 protein [Actinomycetota bacterium]
MFLTKGPRVFAIVLNFRHPGDTIRCIASLRSSAERAIFPVVINNESGGDDANRLRHALGPAVPVLETSANLGYAAGNNHGIRHALERDADYVWILNPDTEVEPATLQMMMATMETRPDAGAVGSLNLVGGSSPSVIQFAGGHIDWAAGAVTTSIGQGEPLTNRPRREPYDVDYVAGTSMLIRRRVFDDVGMLPERYFLYFEETDFQLRAAAKGWKSVMNPLAHVWHYQRSSTHLPAPSYTYYYIRGRILFGKEFTDLSDDELEEGLTRFIGGWRSRIVERAPDCLGTYDHLVQWALLDGRAGRTGSRPEVDAMTGLGG